MERLTDFNDAVLITSPSNLYYFTSFKNADAKLFYVNKKAYYFTDARYFEDAIISLDNRAEMLDIKDFYSFVAQQNIHTLGVEDSLSFAEMDRLNASNITNLVSITTQINKLRAIKSENEIAKMRLSQAITDQTFSDILGEIILGMTERELNCILTVLLYKNGADSLAFDSIVAFGKNTSKPHAQPSDTRLEKGMPIMLDFGAKLNNYCSDMTRTIFFGQPTSEMLDAYNIVLSAQNFALENIKAGMTGQECDSFARAYFEQKGLSQYFLHSLGHSLGIDIHEWPRFSPQSTDIMQENMVLSVEPGLYFADKFGIRIEDVVYFDKNGIVDLTKSPKNIIIV